jgi:streptogramin lyase
MRNLRIILLAGVVSLVMVTGTQAADQVLTGVISSAVGQKLEGVTVSAKMEGSTITTSIYTDEKGAYYFPPLPAGKYRVWAQALGFETAKSSVDLTAGRHQDLVLQPITDAERRFRQLPSELMLAALPEATEQDALMKKIFMNDCTSCHPTGYALQFRFDEAGWNKIIDLMKVVPNNGAYPGPGAPVNKIIDHNQKQLAAYLSRARGPGETSMKFKPRPRPTGEAAQVVWRLYDLPLNPDAGFGAEYNPNDGTDWTLGITSKNGEMPHDGGMGFDGTLYFTVNSPNRIATIGRVDAKTAEVSYLKVPGKDGLAAGAHGMTRDADGNFWFDVNPGRRSLGKLDTKTQKITVYETPKDMTPLGGAVTMDVDGKGKIWASAPNGAVRFDPVTQKFTEFKSLTPLENPKGTNMTYGAAGDRDGNGWWAEMAMDTVGFGDAATGEVSEVKLPPVKTWMDRLSPEDRGFYEKFNELSFNTAIPWSEGPRRMGTDKNADLLWVGDSWGSSLARINTKTREATMVPMPDSTMQAYHVAVDSHHNVWGDLWTNDRIYKFDPSANKWTMFDLPVHGTEIRHISLLERDGKLQVIMPVYRSSQMGVMTIRSQSDVVALRTEAKSDSR